MRTFSHTLVAAAAAVVGNNVLAEVPADERWVAKEIVLRHDGAPGDVLYLSGPSGKVIAMHTATKTTEVVDAPRFTVFEQGSQIAAFISGGAWEIVISGYKLAQA